MTFEETVVIPADHPCLAGHFPGRPIVPGVVLLDRALVMALRHGGWRVSGVVRAKFISPVRPEIPCLMRLTLAKAGTVDLSCTVAGMPVLRATLNITEVVSIR